MLTRLFKPTISITTTLPMTPTLTMAAATSPVTRPTRSARRQAPPAPAATSPLFCCIDRASHFAGLASMASKARRSKEQAHQPLSWADLLGER